MKNIRTLFLGLVLTFTSTFVSADPNQLLSHFQHMRLASISSLSNFFMFSGLNADQKYERRMMKDLEEFSKALEAARGMVAGGAPGEHLQNIESKWKAYTDKLSAHQKIVADMGQISSEESVALGTQGNSLTAAINKAYEDIAATGRPNPKVEEARSLAILLQEMTTQYAASGALGDAEAFHTGEYKRSMADMTKAFADNLGKLSSKARNLNTGVLLDDINSKWGMLSKSLNNQDGNGVPFLIISYNDRIIHHLEELEGMVR